MTIGTFQATRFHDFCCGHRVVGHEGKCRNLHGHNYRVFFTVEAGRVPMGGAGLSPLPEKQLDKVGRVVDFSVIKELGVWLEEYWDHKMLMWSQDPLLAIMDDQVQPLTGPVGIVEVPFNPTAENIAQFLVETVGPRVLPEGIRLVKVVIEETRKCSASYEVFRRSTTAS